MHRFSNSPEWIAAIAFSAVGLLGLLIPSQPCSSGRKDPSTAIALNSPADGTISVESFGAKGDGVTDDAPAIQAALNHMLAVDPNGTSPYNRGGTLRFSCGKVYLCKSPLIIRTPNFAVAIALEGATPGYIVGGAPLLKFPYHDKPGIIIQAGRRVTIRNLSLIGVNDFSDRFKSEDDYASDANYYSTIANVRTDRYSPYAAVTIDSFENTVPPANRYAGLDDLYADLPGGGSKLVEIDHCSIQCWYVGVMLDSSAANAQGDSCFIHHNEINTCTYGIAIGQTQSRGVDLRDNEFDKCKVAFDWATFGQQNGTPPHISGGLVSGIKYLLLGNSTAIGNLQVDGMYGELVCSLGVIAAASHPNNMPVVFSNCQFSFHKSTKQAEAHLIYGGNVKFLGCALASLGEGCLYFQALQNSTSDSPTIEFDNTDVRSSNPSAESQVYVNGNHVCWHNASTWDSSWSKTNTGERHPLTDRRRVSSLDKVVGKLVVPGEVIETPTGVTQTDFDHEILAIGSQQEIKFDGSGGATLSLPPSGTFKIGDIVCGTYSNSGFDISVQGLKVYNVISPKVGVISKIDGNQATLCEVPAFFDSGKIVPVSLQVVRMKRFKPP